MSFRKELIALVVILALGGMLLTVQAQSFSLSNKKLHPIATNKTLSQKQLAQAIFYNQQRIEELKTELSLSRRENSKLRQELRQTQTAFKRFKDYYFRRF